jgi:Icc-related predicted phosphoesterase
MKKKEQIAVITGDIVNSSVLDEAGKKTFQNGIELFENEGILLRPRFYRGDSFQLAVAPKVALSVALKFRMEVRRKNDASDLRISIGIGEWTTWNEDVLLAGGPAFERSGKNLDDLKKKELRIIIVTGNQELDRELETYCYMVDLLIKNLTSVQANVIFYKLEGMLRKQIGDIPAEGITTKTTSMPQDQIGEVLGISQPAVSKTLKAANWKVLNKFLERYEQIIEKNYGISE